MHIPDGFIGPGASAIAGIGAAGGFSVAVRQAKKYLNDRLVPLAALSAAFVFAAQMVNFPVLPGMSGHLIGGVLAAVLVGPSAGFMVLAIVLGVQALVFADGGLSALGLNIINLSGVAAVGGYWIYRVLLRMSTGSARSVVITAGIAGCGVGTTRCVGFRPRVCARRYHDVRVVVVGSVGPRRYPLADRSRRGVHHSRRRGSRRPVTTRPRIRVPDVRIWQH